MIITTKIILLVEVIIVTKREIKKETNKTQEKQMMHSTICHWLLTDAQAVPGQ